MLYLQGMGSQTLLFEPFVPIKNAFHFAELQRRHKLRNIIYTLLETILNYY